MITSLLLAAEGLAQLGCGIGVLELVLPLLVQVWVLVRLVAAPLTLLPVSQRLPDRSSPR